MIPETSRTDTTRGEEEEEDEEEEVQEAIINDIEL